MPLFDRDGPKIEEFVRAEAYSDAPAQILPPEALGDALARRTGSQRIGVALPADFETGTLLPSLEAVDLVAVDFPGTFDGRGFSIARLLRQSGYDGPMRASGPILPDQFAFALVCGFTEVEISEEQAARQPFEQWQAALGRITLAYQGPDSILDRRRAARDAA